MGRDTQSYNAGTANQFSFECSCGYTTRNYSNRKHLLHISNLHRLKCNLKDAKSDIFYSNTEYTVEPFKTYNTPYRLI